MTTTADIEITKRPRADARRNRKLILDAAREVFSEAGAEAQIDDVARRAGVGVGTVYRHFPTKDALLIELMRTRFEQFAENLRAALQRDGEPFEILEQVLRQNAAICARDAAVQYALSGVGDAFWEHIESVRQELITLTHELVGRAHVAGTMRADVGAQDIAMLMCSVSSTMAHTLPGFDWSRHLDLVIDMLRA